MPAPIDRAVTQLRAKAASMAAADRGSKKAPPAKPVRIAKAANSGGGFAFAMDDATDERDAEFIR